MTLLQAEPTVAATVLPWPAPYQAALTICNDLDCTTWEEFRVLHRYLNTSKTTPFGDGLGLPLGDSFWMYTVNPDQDSGFAYFADLEGTPSAAAEPMRELMRAGVLDVLHTYGNFSQRGGFRREHAERAADELRAHDIQPRVWVNHGDCHNFQNIHGPSRQRHCAGGCEYSSGADGIPVRNLEYHLDITRELGVRYLWVGELTQDIGQDRQLSAREHLLARNPLKPPRWLRRDLSALAQSWLVLDGGSGRRGEHDNRLMHRYDLTAGTFYRFTRFGRFGPDRMEHLPLLLSDANLDALQRSGGATVLFAHLGKRQDRSADVLNPASSAALAGVARRFHGGELFVTSTSRLLYYITVRDHLRYTAAQRGEQVVLNIERVEDPVLGTFVPSEADLAGISFGLRIAEGQGTMACSSLGSSKDTRAYPRTPVAPVSNRCLTGSGVGSAQPALCVTIAGRAVDVRIDRQSASPVGKGGGSPADTRYTVQFPIPRWDVGDLLD
ncbi:MAG: hypothetical protein GY842_12715 [bacterium]|nr:hypothetical protein [bacterium]